MKKFRMLFAFSLLSSLLGFSSVNWAEQSGEDCLFEYETEQECKEVDYCEWDEDLGFCDAAEQQGDTEEDQNQDTEAGTGETQTGTGENEEDLGDEFEEFDDLEEQQETQEWDNENESVEESDTEEEDTEQQEDTNDEDSDSDSWGYTGDDNVEMIDSDLETATFTASVVNDFQDVAISAYTVFYSQESYEDLGDEFFQQAETKDIQLENEQVDSWEFEFTLEGLEPGKTYYMVVEPENYAGTKWSYSEQLEFETLAHGAGLDVQFNSKGLLEENWKGKLTLDVGASQDDYMIDVYLSKSWEDESEKLDTISPEQETYELEVSEEWTYNITYKAVTQDGEAIMQDGSQVTSTLTVKEDQFSIEQEPDTEKMGEPENGPALYALIAFIMLAVMGYGSVKFAKRS